MSLSKNLIDRHRDNYVEGFDLGTDSRVSSQSDRILSKRIEVVNSKLSYYGYSLLEDAAVADPVWKIVRVTTNGGDTLETVATGSEGKFNQIWEDRGELFPAAAFANEHSVLLDGINDRVNFGPNFQYDVATQWSFSLWFKVNNLATRQCLYSRTTNDGNVYGWGIYIEPSGKIFIQGRASGTLRDHTSTLSFSAGVWNHLVFSYAGGSNMNGIKLFFNGVQGTSPVSASLNTIAYAQETILGARNTAFPFSGAMDEFSVWNVALSLSEVSDIYNSGSPTDLANSSLVGNIVSYYRMGDGDVEPDVYDNLGVVNGLLENGATFELDVP